MSDFYQDLLNTPEAGSSHTLCVSTPGAGSGASTLPTPRRQKHPKGVSDFYQDVLPLWELSRAQWLAEARALAYELVRRQGFVTVDCIRARLAPPTKSDPRIMGAIFHHADWICKEYKKSTRAECHNRPIGVFVLKTQQ